METPLLESTQHLFGKRVKFPHHVTGEEMEGTVIGCDTCPLRYFGQTGSWLIIRLVDDITKVDKFAEIIEYSKVDKVVVI